MVNSFGQNRKLYSKGRKKKADEEIRTLDPLLQGDALPLSYICTDGLSPLVQSCIRGVPPVNKVGKTDGE